MTEKWYYKGIECSAHAYPESGVVFVSGFNQGEPAGSNCKPVT